MIIKDSTLYPLVAACSAISFSFCSRATHWTHFLLCFILWYILILIIQHRSVHAKEPPVVWSWLPFLGSALTFGGDAVGFVNKCRETYGEAFTLVVAGSKMTIITEVGAYPKYFRASKTLQFNPIAMDVVASAFSLEASLNELETATELFESQIHKIHVERLLNKQGLDELTSEMQAALDTALDQAIEQNLVPSSSSAGSGSSMQVPMFRTIASCIFKSTSLVQFGPNFSSTEDFDEFMAFDNTFAMIVAGVPSSNKGWKKLFTKIDPSKDYEADGSKLIKERAKVLRTVVKENGFSPEVHSSFQRSILWGAASNAMQAAFWTLYFILRDEKVLEQVMASIDEDNLPEKEVGMDILERCITESLRLTSGSLVLRKVMTDDCVFELSDRQIHLPLNRRVAMFPPIQHHEEKYFPSPKVFKPSRFLGEEGDKLAKNYVISFGGGVSKCPGRHLAIREIKYFLKIALTKYEWKLPSTYMKKDENEASSALPFDESRLGLGIYPPKADFNVLLSKKK